MIVKHNDLEIVINDDTLEEIYFHAKEHYPNEFGGFLTGKYSEDKKTAYVTGYILPKKYKGRPTLFERSTEGLTSQFEKLFEQKKEYYLGEWHTHPNGSSQYSGTDLNAMRNTAECETVFIKNPLLLIVALKAKRITEYTFYHYDQQQLLRYE